MKKDLAECYRDTDGMEIYFAGGGLHSIEDIDKIILKKLKALKIIVKKANIRLFEMDSRYYFKTTNNLYEISKEKYDLLKEALNKWLYQKKRKH